MGYQYLWISVRVVGGIWFDDSELYQTRLGAAHGLEEKMNVAKLRKVSIISKEMKCPRDNTELRRLDSVNGLKAVKMNVCPKCDGVWLNKGAFSSWQANRIKKDDTEIKKSKMTKTEYDELDAKIQKQVIAMMQVQANLEKKNAARQQKNILSDLGYVLFLLLRVVFSRR